MEAYAAGTKVNIFWTPSTKSGCVHAAFSERTRHAGLELPDGTMDANFSVRPSSNLRFSSSTFWSDSADRFEAAVVKTVRDRIKEEHFSDSPLYVMFRYLIACWETFLAENNKGLEWPGTNIQQTLKRTARGPAGVKRRGIDGKNRIGCRCVVPISHCCFSFSLPTVLERCRVNRTDLFDEDGCGIWMKFPLHFLFRPEMTSFYIGPAAQSEIAFLFCRSGQKKADVASARTAYLRSRPRLGSGRPTRGMERPARVCFCFSSSLRLLT